MREQIAQQPPIATHRATAARRRASAQQANPHSVGSYAGMHTEDASYQPGELSCQQTDEEEIPDAYYPQRIPNSARRYGRGVSVYEQGNRRLVVHHAPPPRKRQMHPLFIFGLLFSLVIAGVILLSRFDMWWTNQQNTWAYGFPRTYQIDARVGHNDATTPSHFIAINLHSHVEVIEFPGGDATHAKIYMGPVLYGDPDGLTPITLSFQDVNGDGKPDLIIHIEDQTVVFLNNGSQFVSK